MLQINIRDKKSLVNFHDLETCVSYCYVLYDLISYNDLGPHITNKPKF
jgi:hypothetical protein